MKRFTIILTLTLLCATVSAITQKGYVRTIKRPNSVVQRLQGVMIRAKGKNNSIMTDASGNFEIVFDGLKNGEPYSLQTIIKAGYELQEKEIIGRAQPCSDIVPVEILMVNREELAREKLRIEEKARERVEQEYTKRISELDNELQQHVIQEEEYQHQLEELNDKYSRMDKLLGDIADRYARTDYAEMDSLSSMISQAVERGDIYEAERLLRLKGDMKVREAKIISTRDAVSKTRNFVDSVDRANMRDLRDLADDYYHMYSINLTRFNRDSARHFILRRAELDTSNVEYQLQAAQFLLIYTMEYAHAIRYDERALRTSTIRNGRIYGDVATALNDIATAYQNMNRLDEAEDFMNQALEIRRALHGDNDKSIAESYNNIGHIYYSRGDMTKAEKYFKKAIDIRSKLAGNDNGYEMAKSELNLAAVYVRQAKYDKAIQLCVKLLPVLEQHDGDRSAEVAKCNNSLGAAYYYKKDYATSVHYFEKAYSILKQIKGENHQETLQVEANMNAVMKLI